MGHGQSLVPDPGLRVGLEFPYPGAGLNLDTLLHQLLVLNVIHSNDSYFTSRCELL